MASFFSLNDFVQLLQKHGYKIKPNEAEDKATIERIYNMCINHINGELRQALEIGLIHADNKEVVVLNEECVPIITQMMKIFPTKSTK